jgi:hypothetical protein
MSVAPQVGPGGAEVVPRPYLPRKGGSGISELLARGFLNSAGCSCVITCRRGLPAQNGQGAKSLRNFQNET